MEAVYESNIVSPELDQVIQKYTDQGITAQQMINNTDLYTIDVNGDVYTTNVSNINLTFTVSCSPGKVDYQAVCVACPVGTYWSDGFCIRCAVGTYQNETGQQKCETCPNGYTTLYTSSKKRTDCSEKSTFTRSTASTTSSKTLLSSTSNAASPMSEAPRDTNEESVPAITEVIIPGLIVTLLLATIIMTLVALFKYRKHIRRLNRKRQATSQSIASLNMIDPVFEVTSNDNGSPPVSTYTREQ